MSTQKDKYTSLLYSARPVIISLGGLLSGLSVSAASTPGYLPVAILLATLGFFLALLGGSIAGHELGTREGEERGGHSLR